MFVVSRNEEGGRGVEETNCEDFIIGIYACGQKVSKLTELIETLAKLSAKIYQPLLTKVYSLKQVLLGKTAIQSIYFRISFSI